MHKITRNYEFIKNFCTIAQQPTEDGDKFAVPFIEDMEGLTALHMCLRGRTENTRVAEYFLKDLLPNMPLDHHGRAIADVLPECVQRNIKYLGEYLDSRFVTTKQLMKIARAEKKKLKVDDETEEAGYYVTSCDLWPDERYISSKLYDQNRSGTEVKVTILDLPKLHNPSETVADEFAKALSEVEST